MPDGGRAGKVTGAELAAELHAKNQRDAKKYAALGQQQTGHGAETVRRVITAACCICWMICCSKHKRTACCTSFSALQQAYSVAAGSSFSTGTKMHA